MKTIAPAYYMQSTEHLKRFATAMVEQCREAVSRSEAAGREYVARCHRRRLQKWLDVAGCPESFITTENP